MTSGVAQTTEVKKSIRSHEQKFLGHPKVTEELDRLAILYNKTKDKKYKDDWYKLLKQKVR